MVPASNSLTSHNPLSRASTFTKSTAAVAQERVLQLSNHLPRSNTMASQPEQNTPVVQGDLSADVVDVDNQLPPLPDSPPPKSEEFTNCLPPEEPTYKEFSVFLAGSIEMGRAIQWQKRMTAALEHLPITVCNPRRGYWDPNITPEMKDVKFREQVEWELKALDSVSVICFFLDQNTLSPVTLMELGLQAQTGKVVVCCNTKFWKSGNVGIVCERYNIPLVRTMAELIPAVIGMLEKKGMKPDENKEKVTPPKSDSKPETNTLPEPHSYLKFLEPAKQAFWKGNEHLPEKERLALWLEVTKFPESKQAPAA